MAQPQIGEAEREAVLAVLASGQLANGAVTRELEAAFAEQVSHTLEAVAVSSGTAALHLALLAHGIGADDEVITTPFSFQATANMILATGARPVFVDVGNDGNIDAKKVDAAVTSKTRAVLPVHLYGKLCDMAALCHISASHGLALIEDAAQAHGASAGGRYAGSFGTGCFSLYATKNITAGEGGVVTTDDPEMAARLRRLRSHGEDNRYESIELGFNYRMTETSAAIALAQLPRLQELTQRRRHNAEALSTGLKGVGLPAAPASAQEHVWHQYTVRVRQGRDALQAHLKEKGIGTAVYYPKTLPAQKLYRDLGYDEASFPVARQLANEVMSLPVHPGLSDADIQQIIAAVNEWTAS
jgi:dTDP-4-amino-4,6-dideoxygalactose transaminase